MTTFDDFFPIVAYRSGTSYLDARNVLVSLTGVQRDALVARLQTAHAAAPDWETRLGAEILLGWIAHRDDFVMCAIYARGDALARQTIIGYAPFDRAKDIAARGTAVTPRILELLLKTDECPGDEETDALTEALVRLRDPRAADPMASLIGVTAPRDRRGGALRVLASLGDERRIEPALRIIRSPEEALPLRMIAMRALGVSEHYLAFLETMEFPRELRVLAAEMLYRRADPATREAMIDALTRVRDEDVLPGLVLAIGEVATAEDIALLANYEAVAPDAVRPVVRKTIDRIQRRMRQEP